uniref:Dihydrodipicolinate synthetase n=1 Tax=uncultured bacterium F25-01 TaxID=1191433 RepID=I3VIH4_9BACT|nr:dihydrodipicolinate synthetase [uncultured bacterium F25-01]
MKRHGSDEGWPKEKSMSHSVNSDRKAVMIDGVVPIIPTPFRAGSEDVDLEALARLVDFAAGLDLAAICLPAYGSEFYKLTEAERFLVVEHAVRAANGRVPVIAQSNHPSARLAADIARRNADLGADLISFAIPRLFSLTLADLVDYCATICDAVTLPVLIQDFNPGGPTIEASFCVRLRERSPNFRYLKLEEPLMAPKVTTILEATGGEVGILEGWGGMYMLELLPVGICGLMPGLGASDLLARIWRLGRAGQVEAALDLFERILPQLVYSLQNMELFLHLEKRLLVARGVISDPTVRRATYTPSAEVLTHGDLLNRRVLATIETLRPES